MWISDRVFDLFQVNKDSFKLLSESLVGAHAELAALRAELATTKANFAWATGRINTLEMEKTALMEKAYQIKIPAPQLVEAPKRDPRAIEDFSFSDVGDAVAKTLGYDLHDIRN